MSEAQTTAPPRAAAAPRTAKAAHRATAANGHDPAEGGAGVAVAPVKPPRDVKELPGNAAHLVQYKRNAWLIYAREHDEPDDFLSPAMFVTAGGQFALHDRVEVAHARWWEELVVFDVLNGARLQRIGCVVPLPPRDAGTEKRCPEGYEIRPGAPGQPAWVVVRKPRSEGEPEFIMNIDFQDHRTREIALQWLLGLALFRVETQRHF